MKKRILVLFSIIFGGWGFSKLLAPLSELFGPTNNAVLVAQAQADVAEAQALGEIAQWGQVSAANTQTLAQTLGRVAVGQMLIIALLVITLGALLAGLVLALRRTPRAAAPPAFPQAQRSLPQYSAPQSQPRIASQIVPWLTQLPNEQYTDPHAVILEPRAPENYPEQDPRS